MYEIIEMKIRTDRPTSVGLSQYELPMLSSDMPSAVQKVLDDNDLVGLIFDALSSPCIAWINGRPVSIPAGTTRDRYVASGTCKQFLQHRPPTDRQWPLVPDLTSADPDDKEKADLVLCAAKCAGQLERPDECLQLARRYIGLTGKLDMESRYTYFAAYRNVLSSRRCQLRITLSIVNKERVKEKSDKLHLVEAYKRRILDEYMSNLLLQVEEATTILLPNATSADEKVEYLKIVGNAYRELGEIAEGEDVRHAVRLKSAEAYATSRQLTRDHFPATHPLRLGMALSNSSFLYEVQNKHSEAIALAQEALADATEEMSALDEHDPAHRDATLTMQVLRDNLLLWRENVIDEVASVLHESGMRGFGDIESR